MSEDLKHLVKLSCYIAVILAFINYILVKEISFEAIYGYAETGVFLSTIFGVIYERVLWRYNPLLKKPYIAGDYLCRIESSYGASGYSNIKECNAKLEQSLLTLSVRLRTDESQSASITGQLLNENGEDVLYYIYRTEPKALRRHANPSQYGGARLVVESRNIIDGQYWTSEKTLGDLSFERIDHHAH